MSDDEYRRSSDKRLDKMETKIDRIEEVMTKIHTVLVGNGVPGLVSRHDELVQQQKEDKRNIHSRIDNVDNTVKKYVYGIGGIAAIGIVLGIVNGLRTLGVF